VRAFASLLSSQVDSVLSADGRRPARRHHCKPPSVNRVWRLSGEDSYGFDVRGLGEEVKQVEFGDRVAGRGEGFEVAGEAFGGTGDVDQSGRRDAAEQGADFVASPSPRRVEDDKVGAVALKDGGAQEVEGSCFDSAKIGHLGRGKSGCCRLGDLDSGDFGEDAGEALGEETDARVEVPGQLLCRCFGCLRGCSRSETA
jgi:hypothetical protein